MHCVARGDLFTDSDSNGLWEGQLMKVSGDCGCDILSQGLQPFSLHEAFSMYVLPDEYFHDKLLSTDLEVLCNTAVTITVGTFENISHHCELSLNDVQRISFQQFCSYQIQFELLWSVFFSDIIYRSKSNFYQKERKMDHWCSWHSVLCNKHMGYDSEKGNLSKMTEEMRG